MQYKNESPEDDLNSELFEDIDQSINEVIMPINDLIIAFDAFKKTVCKKLFAIHQNIVDVKELFKNFAKQ